MLILALNGINNVTSRQMCLIKIQYSATVFQTKIIKNSEAVNHSRAHQQFFMVLPLRRLVSARNKWRE